MSQNPRLRSLQTEASCTVDKENAFISSNLAQDRKFSISQKFRKVNEILLKPNAKQYGQEVHHSQTINPQAGNMQNKYNLEQDFESKMNITKVKKTLSFERSSLNVQRASDLLAAQRERQSYMEKENRIIEQRERYSYGEKNELKKGLTMNGARAPYAEKEPIRLNPVLEPVAREDKHHEDAIPEITERELEKTPTPTVDINEQCNNSIKDYISDIIKTLKIKDKEATPVYPLRKHKIPVNLRSKMVDWMIEVLSSYKCCDQTFFIAVNLMDLFLEKTNVQHEVSDLHLTGVTCMFMASKYEEIYPLRLSVVHEKIAHRKIHPDQIKKKEMEIFMTLGYKMTNSTPYEFIMNTLHQLNVKETMAPRLYNYLKKVCVYLAKANMHDYELLSQQDYSELAASTLFVAFKIIEQLDKSFPLFEMLNKVIQILKVEEDIVYDCASNILSIAKNFDRLFPNLENLKKFHSFNFEDVPESKDQKSKNSL